MKKINFLFIWLLVFVIPWENTVFLPGLGTLSRILGFGAITIGLLTFFVRGEFLRIHVFHWVLLYFTVLAGASFFWSSAPEDSLTRLVTYLQMLAMVWLIFQNADTPRAVHALLIAYVAGACVSLGSIFWNLASGVEGEWERYSAQGFNPNDMAIILALGIPMAWYLGEARGRSIFSWFGRLYPFAAVIGIALTASRNGLLGATLAMTYPIFTWVRGSLRQKLGVALLAVMAVTAALTFVPEASWARLATFGDAMGGGMNSRTSIWLAGVKAFAERPLFGWGAGAFRFAVEPFFGFPIAPHNVYLSVLVELGLAGFILFTLLIGLGFASLVGMPSRERIFWFVLLGTWCICAFALNWEWRKQTWLLLVLVVTHAAALMPRAKAGTEAVA